MHKCGDWRSNYPVFLPSSLRLDSIETKKQAVKYLETHSCSLKEGSMKRSTETLDTSKNVLQRCHQAMTKSFSIHLFSRRKRPRQQDHARSTELHRCQEHSKDHSSTSSDVISVDYDSQDDSDVVVMHELIPMPITSAAARSRCYRIDTGCDYKEQFYVGDRIGNGRLYHDAKCNIRADGDTEEVLIKPFEKQFNPETFSVMPFSTSGMPQDELGRHCSNGMIAGRSSLQKLYYDQVQARHAKSLPAL